MTTDAINFKKTKSMFLFIQKGKQISKTKTMFLVQTILKTQKTVTMLGHILKQQQTT